MGYLVRAYYSISPTRYYKDDSCWSVDLKSKATEDIISIGSFLEALVLNHYVLVRKILLSSYQQSGWMVEDLDNYHLKELHCSTQCHTLKMLWIVARGDESLILWWVLSTKRFAWSTSSLHRSSNICASLSHKNGKFYFNFKFAISGLLHQWSLQIAYKGVGKDSQRELMSRDLISS
ncbi:hypothetical protein Tco_0001335 [Tanacetum coccineum]